MHKTFCYIPWRHNIIQELITYKKNIIPVRISCN